MAVVLLLVDGRVVSGILREETDDKLTLMTPEGKTIDGRPHPGLKRTTGHIGFLGHGDEVSFGERRREDKPRGSAP